MIVSIENSEPYVWGEICAGWHLPNREEISIIQERAPAGGIHFLVISVPPAKGDRVNL